MLLVSGINTMQHPIFLYFCFLFSIAAADCCQIKVASRCRVCMFGSVVALGGLVNKRRFRLTGGQKYRLNKRLKQVDQVVQTIADSQVSLKRLDVALLAPTQPELTAFQKYWIPSKRYRDGFKPVHWMPHWTKVAHPARVWQPTFIHQEKK